MFSNKKYIFEITNQLKYVIATYIGPSVNSFLAI